MSANRSATVINSKLKDMKPPTIYSCSLCDCANMQVYFKIFNDVKSAKDDNHLERVTHLILLASRLHNAAVEGAILPLVKQLSKGGETMAQEMTSKVQALEECASKIAATKKHANNPEFVQLMEEFQSMVDEASKMEQDALVSLVSEMDEDTLMDGADKMEEAKMGASLALGKMSSA